MATYRELLAAARAEIDEISTPEAHALLDRDGGDAPLFVDVRPRDEWDEGHLPGAMHLPRNNLESRVEALIPDKSRAARRLLRRAARAPPSRRRRLHELGYENAINLVRRVRRLEAERLRVRDPGRARRPRSARATRATC